jgi:hypothetical protein
VLGSHGAPGCAVYSEVRFCLLENHLESVLKVVVRAFSVVVNVKVPANRFIPLRDKP